MKKPVSYALLTIIVTVICFTASAQKLPNKQEESVWVTTIKADKKENKWNLPYKAYNTATDIFYTIANDDKNLYLVIKADKPHIVNKLVYNKITFKVKSNKADVYVKFPVMERKHKLSIVDGVKSRRLKNINDEALLKTKKDSIAKALNQQFLPLAKQFVMNDGKNFKDSTMSIYNETGITVAHHLESDLSYIYELAIPLNVLGIRSAEQGKRIAYTILLNGTEEDGVPTRLSADGKYISRGEPGTMLVELLATPEDIAVSFPTNVSGEYTMAQAPR